MTRKYLSTPAAPQPIGPYSQAVIAGGFLFVSGQIAIDPATSEVIEGDVEAQTELVMKHLMAILAEAKLSAGHVVKTTIFLKDMADFPKVNGIYARYFAEKPPARSTVAVAGLPKGVDVEIDLVATF